MLWDLRPTESNEEQRSLFSYHIFAHRPSCWQKQLVSFMQSQIKSLAKRGDNLLFDRLPLRVKARTEPGTFWLIFHCWLPIDLFLPTIMLTQKHVCTYKLLSLMFSASYQLNKLLFLQKHNFLHCASYFFAPYINTKQCSITSPGKNVRLFTGQQTRKFLV